MDDDNFSGKAIGVPFNLKENPVWNQIKLRPMAD